VLHGIQSKQKRTILSRFFTEIHDKSLYIFNNSKLQIKHQIRYFKNGQIITFLRERKNNNKVALSLKILFLVYQTGWENNSLITFNNLKGDYQFSLSCSHLPQLGQYEKHHVMIPLLINQSNISWDFSLRLSKRLADSDLAVIGLTEIEPIRKISVLAKSTNHCVVR
jgi:hypothetical protein